MRRRTRIAGFVGRRRTTPHDQKEIVGRSTGDLRASRPSDPLRDRQGLDAFPQGEQARCRRIHAGRGRASLTPGSQTGSMAGHGTVPAQRDRLKPMPPPFEVELADYDPCWPDAAAAEASILRAALGPRLWTIHHVGSTSIPGLRVKPILDLMAVVRSLAEMTSAGKASNRPATHGGVSTGFPDGATRRGASGRPDGGSSNCTAMSSVRRTSSAISPFVTTSERGRTSPPPMSGRRFAAERSIPKAPTRTAHARARGSRPSRTPPCLIDARDEDELARRRPSSDDRPAHLDAAGTRSEGRRSMAREARPSGGGVEPLGV